MFSVFSLVSFSNYLQFIHIWDITIIYRTILYIYSNYI